MSTPLERWVDESARLTKPSKIVWCDGSQAENDRLVDGMLRDGTYIELNQKTRPQLLSSPKQSQRRSAHGKHHFYLHAPKG